MNHRLIRKLCAEIVPEWEINANGKLTWHYEKDDFEAWLEMKPLKNHNDANHLVDTYTGGDKKKEKLYEQALHAQIAGTLGGYISTYRMMQATAEEKTLAVLSALSTA